MLRFGVIILSAMGLAASALHAAPVRHAAAKTAEPADLSARLRHAQELARLTQSEDLVVSDAIAEMDKSMVEIMKGNPQFQEIEAVLPGFSQRYWAAARPEILKVFRERLPKMWDGVAHALAAEMTVADIDSATKFFSTPLGAKIIRLQTENLNAKRLIEIGLKHGIDDAEPSPEAATAMKSAASQAAISTVTSLSPSERSAMIAFAVSPAGHAMRRATPGMQKAILEWAAAHDETTEAHMAEIALSVAAQMKAEQKKAE